MAVIQLDDFSNARDLFDPVYRYAENLVPASTTSNIHQNYLLMSTGLIPTGTYHLSVCVQPRRIFFSDRLQWRIQQDGAIDLFEIADFVYAPEVFQPIVKEFVLNLTAATHTFAVDYNLVLGTGPVFIDEANIMLWKQNVGN